MSADWRTPHGYPEWLQLNEQGAVRYLSRNVAMKDGRVRVCPELTPKLKTGEHGYLYIGLRIDGRRINRLVHRLVMLAFAYKDGCELLDVNHKNGIRTDARLSNLEWATRSENNLHAYRVLNRKHPRHTLGQYGRAKAIAVIGTPINGGPQIRFVSQLQAKRHGFQQTSISACILGKAHTHKGYTWERDTKEGIANEK